MFVRWWWQLRCILLGVFILMWRWKFPWVWVDVFIIKKYPLYWRNRTIFHNETGLLQFSALHLNHFSLCPGWCFVKYGAAWAQKIDPVEGNFVKLTSCVCLFHSAFCVAAFKVVLGVLDQCFRLVGCLPQTQHHKNAYCRKAPFNKGIKKGPALFGQEICIVYIYTSHLIGCKFSEVTLQLVCLKSFVFLWCTSVRTLSL